MNTEQHLPRPVRSFCKYELMDYQQALQIVQRYCEEPITDAYGQRCERIVKSVEAVKNVSDNVTKMLLDLVYLQRSNISVEAAADVLEISKNRAYSHINRILLAYARENGYVKCHSRRGEQTLDRIDRGP